MIEELSAEVALNTVIGLSNSKTMKLLGVTGGHDVVVMIDLGSTHNLISLKTSREVSWWLWAMVNR